MLDPNRSQLTAAAEALQPLLGELVFVGGCVIGLLITDQAAAGPRPTLDVDAIAEITSYAQYSRFADRLRALGFNEDTREGAPLCRWTREMVTLDVMPLDENILGFSNRWYREAMRTSATASLSTHLRIRTATAPCFLATKLEAFKGRGASDFLTSHDIEDVVAVIDGRESLLSEVTEQSAEILTYIATELGSLIANPRFLDALPAYLLPDPASQSRIEIVLRRMRKLADLANRK
jgi:hypothetical protein